MTGDLFNLISIPKNTLKHKPREFQLRAKLNITNLNKIKIGKKTYLNINCRKWNIINIIICFI